MHISWFSFFTVISVASAKFACVNLSGQVKCIKGYEEKQNVKIEVLDENLGESTDLMGMGFSQSDGTFAIFACGEDYDWFGENFPDPIIRITHSCARSEERSYKYYFNVVFAPQEVDLGVLILDFGVPVKEESYYSKMQETTDEKIEISSDFDKLEFGIENEIVSYGRTKSVASIVAQTSSTSALICGVIKKCCVKFVKINLSPLPNHIVGYHEESGKVYIRAEVRYENLDNGADITEKSLSSFKTFSCKGDIPHQYISKNIGGFASPLNIFPLIPTADITPLQAAIQKVYDHVRNGEEYSARLIYVINYDYENGNTHGERPSQIFFVFKLYKHGQLFGEEKIEGKIENPLPPPRIYKSEKWE